MKKMQIKIVEYINDFKTVLEKTKTYLDMNCEVILNFEDVDSTTFEFNRLFAYMLHNLIEDGYKKDDIIKLVSIRNICGNYVWSIFVDIVNCPLFVEKFKSNRKKQENKND